MRTLPAPEGFTFQLACPTREMFSSVVSISIATSDGRLPKKPVSVLTTLQLIRGWLCSRNRVSRSSRYFRFRKSAAEMRASILDQDEALPELSDVHIVRAPSDLKPRMLHLVRAFLLHFWARDGGR